MATKLVKEMKDEPKMAGKKLPGVTVALAQDRQKVGVKRLQPRSSSKSVTALKLRRILGLSQPEFAGLLSVSTRTVAAMESTTKMTETQVRRLNELTRLTNALTGVIKKESLGRWLKEPNPAFDDLKPVEVIARGEVDKIWSMIYFLRSGVPG